MIGAVVAGTVAIACTLAWKLHTASRRIFEFWSKQSPGRSIRYVLDDEGFDVQLEHSSARYTWKGLRRLWRYSDVWIVEIVKNLSVFFPPDAVPAEVREYVVERCRDAGVRV